MAVQFDLPERYEGPGGFDRFKRDLLAEVTTAAPTTVEAPSPDRSPGWNAKYRINKTTDKSAMPLLNEFLALNLQKLRGAAMKRGSRFIDISDPDEILDRVVVNLVHKFDGKYNNGVKNHDPDHKELRDSDKDHFDKWILQAMSFESSNAHYHNVGSSKVHPQHLGEDFDVPAPETLDDSGTEIDETKAESYFLLRKSVDMLVPGSRKRQVAEAFYFGGKEYREIAHELGITENAAYVIMNKLRKEILAQLDALDYDCREQVEGLLFANHDVLDLVRAVNDPEKHFLPELLPVFPDANQFWHAHDLADYLNVSTNKLGKLRSETTKGIKQKLRDEFPKINPDELKARMSLYVKTSDDEPENGPKSNAPAPANKEEGDSFLLSPALAAIIARKALQLKLASSIDPGLLDKIRGCVAAENMPFDDSARLLLAKKRQKGGHD